MKYGYAIIPIPMNIGFQRLKRLPKMNPTKPMLLKNSPAKRFAPEMCGMTDFEAKIRPAPRLIIVRAGGKQRIDRACGLDATMRALFASVAK